MYECEEMDDGDDTESNIELFSITKYSDKGGKFLSAIDCILFYLSKLMKD